MTTAPAIGVKAVSLRYQNVYGPGQSLKNPYTGILSIFSTLIRQGKAINIFEDGQESRDFVFIDDVVEATFRACVSPDAGGTIINVGSGSRRTVVDVVNALFRAFGATVPVTVSGNFRVGDIRHNIADTTALARCPRVRVRACRSTRASSASSRGCSRSLSRRTATSARSPRWSPAIS